MPMYEYECKKCGHKFEEIQTIKEKPLKDCPKCGKIKSLMKVLGGNAIHIPGEITRH